MLFARLIWFRCCLGNGQTLHVELARSAMWMAPLTDALVGDDPAAPTPGDVDVSALVDSSHCFPGAFVIVARVSDIVRRVHRLAPAGIASKGGAGSLSASFGRGQSAVEEEEEDDDGDDGDDADGDVGGFARDDDAERFGRRHRGGHVSAGGVRRGRRGGPAALAVTFPELVLQASMAFSRSLLHVVDYCRGELTSSMRQSLSLSLAAVAMLLSRLLSASASSSSSASAGIALASPRLSLSPTKSMPLSPMHRPPSRASAAAAPGTDGSAGVLRSMLFRVLEGVVDVGSASASSSATSAAATVTLPTSPGSDRDGVAALASPRSPPRTLRGQADENGRAALFTPAVEPAGASRLSGGADGIRFPGLHSIVALLHSQLCRKGADASIVTQSFASTHPVRAIVRCVATRSLARLLSAAPSSSCTAALHRLRLTCLCNPLPS
jgi:hypothetical protein